MTKEYGTTGWILGSSAYSDGMDVSLTNESLSATIQATFTGTLKEAVAAAPALGSLSELIPGEMRLYKRSFTEKGDVVSATFTYGVYGAGSEGSDGSASIYDDAKYELETTSESVPLLMHEDFKDASEAERALAQAYINGNTDATAIWASKSAYELATSVPESEEANWEKTTLARLVKKFAPKSELVELARSGKKSIPGNVYVWKEVRTSGKPDYSTKLGEKSKPRGSDYPPASNWTLDSINSKQVGTDEFGNKTFEVTTTWKASQNMAET